MRHEGTGRCHDDTDAGAVVREGEAILIGPNSERESFQVAAENRLAGNLAMDGWCVLSVRRAAHFQVVRQESSLDRPCRCFNSKLVDHRGIHSVFHLDTMLAP